jgi:hypothetical protein
MDQKRRSFESTQRAANGSINQTMPAEGAKSCESTLPAGSQASEYPNLQFSLAGELLT